jgi:Gpi16 subunit, GPI transamidase component
VEWGLLELKGLRSRRGCEINFSRARLALILSAPPISQCDRTVQNLSLFNTIDVPALTHSAQAAMRQLQPFLLVLAAIFTFAFASSDYHEQLVLRPLQPSLLLASFNFQSNTSWESFEQQNFRYFPRSLGQILKHANTRELHLRFSLGQWDAESWGARPWGGTREGGTGVELWAWVEAETDEE